jgi:hypothetical protein
MRSLVHPGGGEKNLEGACEIQVFHLGKKIDAYGDGHGKSLLERIFGLPEGPVKAKDPGNKGGEKSSQKKKEERKSQAGRFCLVRMEKEQKNSSQKEKKPRSPLIEKRAQHFSGPVLSGRMKPVLLVREIAEPGGERDFPRSGPAEGESHNGTVDSPGEKKSFPVHPLIRGSREGKMYRHGGRKSPSSKNQ